MNEPVSANHGKAKAMSGLWAWLLTRLQDRCEHDPSHVSADILEGDVAALNVMVQWCRRCGAYRRIAGNAGRPAEHVSYGWNRPRPLWTVGR